MDLGAYIQIEALESVAEANGIHVSRLRGYRLMRDQKAYTNDELTAGEKYARMHAYEQVLSSAPPFSLNPQCYGRNDKVRRREKKYLIKDSSGHTVGFRINLLHGKRRKAVKYEVKRFVRMQRTQMSIWNRYAGREDVLYIHARLGSWNWSGVQWRGYKKEVWFLDGCDDIYDPSYCDIYARIDPATAPCEAGEHSDYNAGEA